MEENETELRRHRCCFTGHRPEKLTQSEEAVRDILTQAIRDAVGDGYTTFITGMARGVDIVAAEIVLSMKESGAPLRLICACPYPGCEKRWRSDWQRRFRDILAKADAVRTLSDHYSFSCYQKRDEWMVDHAALVLAVYNGTPGGTKNTMDYARAKGVPVRDLL